MDAYLTLVNYHSLYSYWSITKSFFNVTKVVSLAWVIMALTWYPYTHSPTFYLWFRYVQPRGNPEPGAELQNAEARKLSRWALWHHVCVLERKPRGQAYLRVPEERSGGFLHCHRKAVSGVALMGQRDMKTYNNYTQTKGTAFEGGCLIVFCLLFCL